MDRRSFFGAVAAATFAPKAWLEREQSTPRLAYVEETASPVVPEAPYAVADVEVYGIESEFVANLSMEVGRGYEVPAVGALIEGDWGDGDVWRGRVTSVTLYPMDH